MTSIRIAHLSDLHASASDSTARPIVDAAISDIVRAHEEKPIDLVAFTGDLAKTGSSVDYEVAHDWLIDPLREALGLDMSRFVLVPGNHDVDRLQIDPFQEEGMRSGLIDESAVAQLMQDEGTLDRALARLGPWNDYQSLLVDGVVTVPATRLAATRMLTIDATSIGVAALNTAWRSSGDLDKGFLLLGRAQLDQALVNIAECDLRIVLMHHPYEWLAPFDSDIARTKLEGARTLVLSGHDHKTNPTAEFSLRGGAIYSRAGCLFESEHALNGYTLIDADLDTGTVSFLLRSWYPAPRNAFDQATHLVEGGKFELQWVDQSMTAAKADYSTVLETLGHQASEISVVSMMHTDIDAATPDQYLVEPKLWSARYEEITAARDLDGATEPEPVDVLAALDQHDTVILVGEPESGISGSLLWILATHFERRGTHTPYFGPLEKKFKGATFEKTLRRNANAAGQHATDPNVAPPSLVAIDDAGTPSSLQHLVDYIAGAGDHKFVLGVHDAESASVVKALEDKDVPFLTLYIGPLGRAQVRDMIEKLGGLADSDVDRIFGLIVNQHLPRTPLLIAALIVAIQQNQDPISFNESALLDACVRVLLSIDTAPDEDSGAPLDPRQREHLLAWFAGRMTLLNADRLPTAQAEREIAEYFRDRGWGDGISPGGVLSGLVHRRALTRDSEGVGFRHHALRDLFIGKWMIDDPNFKETALQDPLSFAKAIRHAAGLQRDDKVLLSAVHARGIDVIKGLDPDVDVALFDKIKDEKGWSEADDGVAGIKAILSVEARDPDRQKRDDQLERAYDDFQYDPAKEDEEQSGALPGFATALELMSGVLRHSELVPDVAMKESVLRDSLHGWSLAAILMAIQEDQTDAVRERVESGDIAELIDEDSQERVAELMMTMIMGVAITSSLASPKLEEVATSLLDDEDFMKPTAHALFATLYFVLMRFHDWDQRLMDLFEAHGAHPIVKLIVTSLSASLYRSPIPNPRQVKRLEGFLIMRMMQERKLKGGGVVQGLKKADAIRQLQTGRQQALMAKRLHGPTDADLDNPS